MTNFGSLWGFYKDQAIPKSASSAQIEFAEIAFYAGAAALFALVMDKLDSSPDNSDGGKFLFELEQELIKYMEQVPTKATI